MTSAAMTSTVALITCMLSGWDNGTFNIRESACCLITIQALNDKGSYR